MGQDNLGKIILALFSLKDYMTNIPDNTKAVFWPLMRWMQQCIRIPSRVVKGFANMHLS